MSEAGTNKDNLNMGSLNERSIYITGQTARREQEVDRHHLDILGSSEVSLSMNGKLQQIIGQMNKMRHFRHSYKGDSKHDVLHVRDQHLSYYREKGRDPTQSNDKHPYPTDNAWVKLHEDASKCSITYRLRTD